MQYILDANIFITAFRDRYPHDVVPGFWDKVLQLAQENKIASIDKVKHELKSDWLVDWIKTLPADFFQSTATIHLEYGKVVRCADSRKSHYKPKALDEFMDSKEADAFLIAYALSDVDNLTIVTYETPSNAIKKVKIPEPCAHFNIRCINPIEMFRELGETF